MEYKYNDDHIFGLPTIEYIKNMTRILMKVIDDNKTKKPERSQFAYEMLFRLITQPHVLNKLKRGLIIEYINLLERLEQNKYMPDTFVYRYYINVLEGNEDTQIDGTNPSYVKPSKYVVKMIEMYEKEILNSEKKIYQHIKSQIPFNTHLHLSTGMMDYWKSGNLNVFKTRVLKMPTNEESNFRLSKTRLYEKDICKKMKKGSYATLWKIRNLLIRESKFDEQTDETKEGSMLIHECNMHITACMNNMLHLRPNPHFIPVYNQVMDMKNKLYYQTMNYTPITNMTDLTDTFTDDMMFQLLCIFRYIQDNLHMVHNDVHFNNLSVQEMSYTNDYDRFTYYKMDGKLYKINTYKHGLIKLYDFDLACLYDLEIGNGKHVNVVNHNLQELSDGFPYYPDIYKKEKIDQPFYMFDFLWLLYNLIYEVNIDADAHLTKYLIHRYLIPHMSWRMIWKSESASNKHTPEYVEYVRQHPNCDVKHIRFSQIKRKNVRWLCGMVENSPFKYNKKLLLPNKMKIFTDFYMSDDDNRGLKVSEIMNDENVKNAISKFECVDRDERIMVYDI